MSIYDDAQKLRDQLQNEQNEKLKIALFGQPGAGKSSIINKLIGSHKVEVGVTTDKTTEATIVEWENLLLVDLPGYGTTKFPQNKYFDYFNIEDYHLFLCVFSGKFHQADTEFFRELRRKDKVCIFIRNYSDTLWEDGKTIEELKDDVRNDVTQQVESPKTIYFTSCRTGEGIKELSTGIYENVDPAQKAKWTKSAKAYSKEFLEMKQDECKKMVWVAAGAAAVNGFDPIPGVDIGIDVGIIFSLFQKIRNSYGLVDDKLRTNTPYYVALAPVINNVIEFASKEGIMVLLKRYAGRQVVKTVTKYIPFVGQAIAALLGFAITKSAGESYLNDCHTVAIAILENELKGNV